MGVIEAVVARTSVRVALATVCVAGTDDEGRISAKRQCNTCERPHEQLSPQEQAISKKIVCRGCFQTKVVR